MENSYVTFLELKILMWFLNFWNICASSPTVSLCTPPDVKSDCTTSRQNDEVQNFILFTLLKKMFVSCNKFPYAHHSIKWLIRKEYTAKLSRIYVQNTFFIAQQPLWASASTSRDFRNQIQLDTPESVGLLWARDQVVAKTPA